MALAILLKRKKLTDLQARMADLEKQVPEFEAREAELAASIEEASTEEERSVVEEAVTAFETERTAHNTEMDQIRADMEALENEIREAEDQARQAQTSAPATRKEGNKPMETRAFFNLNAQERDAFFANQEVKDFLQRVRELKSEQRSVTGAELLIPTVALDILRDQIAKYSKLMKYVRLRKVPGKARQPIMGSIPEAIWTEAVGKLNELSIDFNALELDGYKIGGFIPVPNSLLEDASDVDLAAELLDVLGQSIGLGLDKAIIYGTGAKMPLGIVPRLAQTLEPDAYPANAPAWKDLHTSNMINLGNVSGTKLIQGIINAFGKANGDKSATGAAFHAMSHATHCKLMSESLGANASAALVAGMNNTMPVIGGDIVELPFIPADEIISGFDDLYVLVERAGAALGTSEHVRFIEDQTVVKGTGRYDGEPGVPDGFVAMGINKVPTGSLEFAADTANA